MDRASKSVVSAAQVLTPGLRGGVGELRRAESDIRLDQARAVHDFRVSARRLRSVLTAAQGLFGSTEDLAADLRTAGRAAGPTRDVDVLRQRLVRSLGDQPAGTTVLLLGERLDRELEGQRRRHWVTLVDYLDSPAFDRLARRLDAYSDLTPWAQVAAEPAVEVLPPILERHHRHFDSMAKGLGEWPSGPKIDEGLHDLRKQAKAVRYLSDAFRPALPGRAKKVRKAMRHVQTVLGDLCDSQLLVAHLERRLQEDDLNRSEQRILRRLHADELAKAAYLRSQFFGAYLDGLARAPAS